MILSPVIILAMMIIGSGHILPVQIKPVIITPPVDMPVRIPVIISSVRIM
jgi:hypothetical protein